MSEPTSDFCAAYGCPMLGTFGNSGKWYCCCHRGANTSLNDAITLTLAQNKPLVDRAVALRRESAGYAAILKAENELFEITRQVGEQKPLPVGGVLGSDHAEPHYTEQE